MASGNRIEPARPPHNLVEQGGGAEALSVALRRLGTAVPERLRADHVDVRKRPPGPRRESPSQQCGNIAVRGRTYYLLFQAADGFDGLDVHEALPDRLKRGLLDTLWAEVRQPRPQATCSIVQMIVVPLADLLAQAAFLLDHMLQELHPGRLNIGGAEILGRLDVHLVEQFQRHLVADLL